MDKVIQVAEITNFEKEANNFMVKKLTILGIALIMLSLVAGLSACDNLDLASYKTTAKTALQNHADAKLEANGYSAQGLADIAVILSDGKAAITAATDKPAVDTAKEDAIQAINAVPQKEEEMDVIKEKIAASWWDDKVEVAIIFPRVVQQGDSFSIEVTTTNILDFEIEYWSGSCCQNKGVLITKIKLQSETEYEMKHGHFDAHNEDYVQTIISASENIVFTWEIETTHPEQFVAGVAPKGIYDICLSNGEVYRSAIEII